MNIESQKIYKFYMNRQHRIDYKEKNIVFATNENGQTLAGQIQKIFIAPIKENSKQEEVIYKVKYFGGKQHWKSNNLGNQLELFTEQTCQKYEKRCNHSEVRSTLFLDGIRIAKQKLQKNPNINSQIGLPFYMPQSTKKNEAVSKDTENQTRLSKLRPIKKNFQEERSSELNQPEIQRTETKKYRSKRADESNIVQPKKKIVDKRSQRREKNSQSEEDLYKLEQQQLIKEKAEKREKAQANIKRLREILNEEQEHIITLKEKRDKLKGQKVKRNKKQIKINQGATQSQQFASEYTQNEEKQEFNFQQLKQKLRTSLHLKKNQGKKKKKINPQQKMYQHLNKPAEEKKSDKGYKSDDGSGISGEPGESSCFSVLQYAETQEQNYEYCSGRESGYIASGDQNKCRNIDNSDGQNYIIHTNNIKRQKSFKIIKPAVKLRKLNEQSQRQKLALENYEADYSTNYLEQQQEPDLYENLKITEEQKLRFLKRKIFIIKKDNNSNSQTKELTRLVRHKVYKDQSDEQKQKSDQERQKKLIEQDFLHLINSSLYKTQWKKSSRTRKVMERRGMKQIIKKPAISHVQKQRKNEQDSESSEDILELSQKDPFKIISLLNQRICLIKQKEPDVLMEKVKKYLQIMRKHLKKSQQMEPLSPKRQQTLLAIFKIQIITLEKAIETQILLLLLDFIIVFEDSKSNMKSHYSFIYEILNINLKLLIQEFEARESELLAEPAIMEKIRKGIKTLTRHVIPRNTI